MNTLVYKDLTDNMFIPVIRKRNIVKARPLSRKEKKEEDTGVRDILLTGPHDEDKLITRRELLDNYTYLNGKSIKLSGWTSKKTYMVNSIDNTKSFAMLIPNNCNIDIQKIKKRQGDYIICLTGDNGNINRESARIIANKTFKKMFHIPENDVITRNKGKGNKEFNPDKVVRKKRKNNRNDGITDKDKLDFGLNKDKFKQLADEIKMQPDKVSDNSILRKDRTENVGQTKKQYSAIGKLMSDGVLTGFVIQNSKGVSRNITKKEMMQLCQRKMVSNIMLTKNESSNKYFLRGNGMRIDTLPSINVTQ